MHATTNRLEFAPPPPPGLLRAFGLAILAHAFLLAALTWGVHWKRQDVSIAVEAELWSALPREAAPKLVEPPPAPVEKPQPKPVPKPQPVPEKAQPVVPDPAIALERAKRLKKERLEAEHKLEQERLAQEKLKLIKKQELEKKALDDKKKAEQEANKRKETLKAQQEAARIEAQRQENINRMKGLAGASGAPTATGTAMQSSGPSAGYAGKIVERIKSNTNFSDAGAGHPTVIVLVRVAAGGTILSRTILTPSNNKAWDEAVLRAIDKMESLPRDTDGKIPGVVIREGLELKVTL